MNGLIITQEQINELRRAHRSAKDKRSADRIKAIYSLAVGYSAKEVADILMIDDETLRNYLKRYQEGGVKALLENNYKGSNTNLSEMEIKELDLHVKSNSYLSVDGIVDYVYKAYGIKYSVSGMTQLLHRLDFVYKKAKIIPGKANAELQEAYLAMLMKLLENKDKNDPHYFTDGVHPQHNTMPSHGWVKKGEDKIIKTNSARKRININGALNSETLEVVTHTSETINAQSTIELFKAIEFKHPLSKNIYITLDNAQYYRSKLVKAYLETSKIKLLFLPSYSPNLNLIERLWKYMKKALIRNQYYEKFSDFKNSVNHFFENISQHKNKLSTLLTMKFHILHAA
jgi:transposase